MEDDEIKEKEESEGKIGIIFKIVHHILDPKVFPWIIILFMTNVGQLISNGVLSKYLGIEVKPVETVSCCSTIEAVVLSNAELQKHLLKCRK